MTEPATRPSTLREPQGRLGPGRETTSSGRPERVEERNPEPGTPRSYFDLARPFTLVAPALGFLSGALTAVGAAPPEVWSVWLLVPPVLGSAMAALLNAGNNALNQIYDLDIDRVNKPRRPLPSGRLTVAQTWRFTNITYGLALILAWFVVPVSALSRSGPVLSLSGPALSLSKGHECFWLVAVAVVCTYVYSVPPLRTKRLGIWANITIAIPRGMLLKVAGWSSVKTVIGVEPWYIGAIFGLFLLGATTTKDFADMEGDRRGGCRTLPIQYGVRRAAWMISPSFVIPFAMIPLGAWLHVLTGNFWLLQLLGGGMIAYGIYVCYLMLRRPEDLAVEENHVSWAHMYRMMFVAQIGFALAYLL
jgi:4-hydroxybenzoate polyprenyltransferase